MPIITCEDTWFKKLKAGGCDGHFFHRSVNNLSFSGVSQQLSASVLDTIKMIVIGSGNLAVACTNKC